MLTWTEQDDIIIAITAAYRVSHYKMLGYWPGPDDNEESFRAALRLDDDKLARIIADHPEGLSWAQYGLAR